jgi:hypothetical protein
MRGWVAPGQGLENAELSSGERHERFFRSGRLSTDPVTTELPMRGWMPGIQPLFSFSGALI